MEENRLGPYRLIRQLGTGGMAETWLAAQPCIPGVHKLVALKCILPSYNHIPDYIRLFYHEAKIALYLQHPNLPGTWSCSPIEGRHVMVMEYMRGVTLEALLTRLRERREGLRYEIAAWIAVQILDGLDYLHNLEDDTGRQMGIIHRDVTPDNIFLCFDGQCKLFDFGVSRTRTEIDLQHGMIVGKPAYMSPEQCQGLELDGRSDDFALAVVLYEMTTGIKLFDRESEIQTLNAVMSSPIEPPAMKVRDFPAFLSRSIRRGLERDPRLRYANSAEFANDLRMYLKVNGKADARQMLHALLLDVFRSEYEDLRYFLSETSQELDAISPSLEAVIASSRQITTPASGLSECLLSRLDDMQLSRAQILSNSSDVPTVTDMYAPQMPVESEEENHPDMHKSVAQRMKKWIFGDSQSDEPAE